MYGAPGPSSPPHGGTSACTLHTPPPPLPSHQAGRTSLADSPSRRRRKFRRRFTLPVFADSPVSCFDFSHRARLRDTLRNIPLPLVYKVPSECFFASSAARPPTLALSCVLAVSPPLDRSRSSADNLAPPTNPLPSELQDVASGVYECRAPVPRGAAHVMCGVFGQGGGRRRRREVPARGEASSSSTAVLGRSCRYFSRAIASSVTGGAGIDTGVPWGERWPRPGGGEGVCEYREKEGSCSFRIPPARRLFSRAP